LASLTLVIVAAAILSYASRDNRTFFGSKIDPPMPAPDFTLVSQTSLPARLSDFRGKFVLLFFGFTNCPDICPATMGVLKQVQNRLEDQSENVQVLLVTTDPDHDSPQALGTFLGRFDPTFIGLTGTKAELEQIWADYGVTVLDNGTTHSTRVYVIDREGNIPLTYPSATNPENIAADLRLLFEENEQ